MADDGTDASHRAVRDELGIELGRFFVRVVELEFAGRSVRGNLGTFVQPVFGARCITCDG